MPSNSEARPPGGLLGFCLSWFPSSGSFGCLFRLAPQPDKSTSSKGSLIVNLSAYGGSPSNEDWAWFRESLDIVRLEEEDMVKIFVASTLLMAPITRQPVGWSQRQPR